MPLDPLTVTLSILTSWVVIYLTDPIRNPLIRRIMSAKAQKRIAQEYADLSTTLPQDIESITLNEDSLFSWTVTLLGPSDSPYKGGKFTLLLTIPAEYPFKPPALQFKTPIYHPNITNDGQNPSAPTTAKGKSSRAAPPAGSAAAKYAASLTPSTGSSAGAASAAEKGVTGLPPGSMCLAMLKQEVWKPASRIRGVLESCGQILREPNVEDAVEGDIAELFGRDRELFEKRVKEWVDKFAK